MPWVKSQSLRGGAVLCAIVAAALGATVLPAPAAANCEFFEHANFEGRVYRMRAGTSAVLPFENHCDWCNDSFSSYRITTNRQQARVSLHWTGEGGPVDTTVLTGQSPYVGPRLNDAITFVRCERADVAQSDSCFAYRHGGLEGRRLEIPAGRYRSRLAPADNDEFTSFQVPPGHRLVLFEHAEFMGESRAFGPGTHDLGGSGFNDQTSSIRCERLR